MIRSLSTPLRRHFRMSVQMYAGIAGAVTLTLSASIVAWLSFNQIDDATDRVNDGSLPEMVHSFGVAQYTAELAAAAPRISAATTQIEFAAALQELAQTVNLFEVEMTELDRIGIDRPRLLRIQDSADGLTDNIDEIVSLKSTLLDVDAKIDATSARLDSFQRGIDGYFHPTIDELLFRARSGSDETGIARLQTSGTLPLQEFLRYRNFSELNTNFNDAVQLLASALVSSDAVEIGFLEDHHQLAMHRIESGLQLLDDADLASDLESRFDEMVNLALGEDGGFALVNQRLKLIDNLDDSLANNRDISVALVNEVDMHVNVAENAADGAATDAINAISIARIYLIGISAVSVIGAFLITWLYVGRVVIRRIQTLSERMISMANGDLETKVDIGGDDEVTDMADALEVFRQHAIEVERLNPVEQLAKELQAKNEELERVLEELQDAQDQIIAQGKLAALGELTAGVAHEIRNPLNFVNNFAESSQELIEELREAVDDASGNLTDDAQEYLEEISGDILENLTRIKSHGDRANRIVHGMLAMGRGSTDVEATDINSLVDEYTQLGYHGMRATDPNMNIEIVNDFDPNIPQLTVVPQDLGRVFLNIVSNATHATDDKLNALEPQASNNGTYSPRIDVSTRAFNNRVEIRFKDNGTGMPPEVAEKIFNPFFTTKPTHKGTGLGLSLANDIVRSHGGSISVTSAPDEFTEFLIVLPVDPPSAMAANSTTQSTDD